ncbi:MAG: type II toxin-antitoxin system death-on-curing family toxin [Gemmatimonadota bacterium]
MTRYLALTEVLDLHRRVMEASGGATGLRDLGLLEAAIAQPRQSFAGSELYPTMSDKAAAIGFSLIQNHPFVDGNKRVGHAAMEVMLVLNGMELDAMIDESEQLILGVASGNIDRAGLTSWIALHMRRVK